MGRKTIKIVKSKECPVCRILRCVDPGKYTWKQVMCIECILYFYVNEMITDDSISRRGLNLINKKLDEILLKINHMHKSLIQDRQNGTKSSNECGG